MQKYKLIGKLANLELSKWGSSYKKRTSRGGLVERGVRQVGGASHTGDRGLELSEENREVRK